MQTIARLDFTAVKTEGAILPADLLGRVAQGDDLPGLTPRDYHLAAMIGWTFLGHPIDDDEMVEYLASFHPHRYRAVRLLIVSGSAVKPKFGPRTPITDHRSR